MPKTFCIRQKLTSSYNQLFGSGPVKQQIQDEEEKATALVGEDELDDDLKVPLHLIKHNSTERRPGSLSGQSCRSTASEEMLL